MISLNAKELAQLLNDRGWYVVRQRGSHARWYIGSRILPLLNAEW